MLTLDKPEQPLEDMSRVRLAASPEGVQAFLQAHFGLSIHWGLYSLDGRGEWVYFTERIAWETYRQRLARFNPVRFDAEEWADLMLESGQKFMIITTKHHDGFCLWDTDLTEFKITRTPFRRDVIAELADALHARGLQLHFYYSLLDWTYPTYRKEWPAYVAYYQGQLTELLTRYGRIDGVVFDGYWPRAKFENDEIDWFAPRGAFDLAGTYDLIHRLQPQAVVANNLHILPLKGEDYQVWELDLPGKNTIGFNTTEMGSVPKGCWWNLNQGWAYAPRTHQVKTAADILATMKRVREAGGELFLLNVGPRPWGDIHPDEQAVLREIGARRRACGC